MIEIAIPYDIETTSHIKQRQLRTANVKCKQKQR